MATTTIDAGGDVREGPLWEGWIKSHSLELGAMRILGDGPSKGALVLLVGSAFVDQALRSILGFEEYRVLDDQTRASIVRYPPAAHPRFPNLYAREVVNMQGMKFKGKEVSSAVWYKWPADDVQNAFYEDFDYYILTIQFETATFLFPDNISYTGGDDHKSDVDQDGRRIWISRNSEYGTQSFNTPVGQFYFQENVYNTLDPAPTTSYLTAQPTRIIQGVATNIYTWHRVPQDAMDDPPDVDGFGRPTSGWRSCLGKINNADFIDIKKGLGMLDGWRQRAYCDWRGVLMNDIDFRIQVNSIPWNSQLDNANILRYLGTVKSTTHVDCRRPYDEADFNQIFSV